MVTHIFHCSPGRPIDSADYLVMYCIKNEFPVPDLVEGFGFERCQSQNDWIMLFGLYIGLVNYHNVSSRSLHQWQQENDLARNICKTFEGRSNGYYKWFLNNKHFVDANTPEPQLEEKAFDMDSLRKYLPEEDRNTPLSKMEPVSKKEVSILYASLIGGWSISPTMDMWMTFGFPTCSSPNTLCWFYVKLFEKSTFEEFHLAYKTGSLEKLAREKGMAESVDKLRKNGVMIGLPKVYPSCYNLKQYVLCGDVTVEPPRSVRVDYGFYNCTNAREKILWKDTYLQLFNKHAYKACDLHQACISGTIYDYIKRLLPDTPPELRSMTSNIYPLESGPTTIR